MGTKTLSIREETYEMLKGEKREGESFSDVIDRLMRREKFNLEDYLAPSRTRSC